MIFVFCFSNCIVFSVFRLIERRIKMSTLSLISIVFFALLLAGMWGIYIKKFLACPREFWLMAVVGTLLSTYSITKISYISILESAGMGQSSVFTVAVGFSIAISIFSFFGGVVLDGIGIKRTLQLSTVLMVLGNISLMSFTNSSLLLLFGLFPFALALGLQSSYLFLGFKRYTTEESRVLAFHFFPLIPFGYGVSVIAFFKEYFETADRAYKMGLAVETLALIAALFILRYMRCGVVVDENDKITFRKYEKRTNPVSIFKDSLGSLKSVLKTKEIYFLLLIIASLFGAKSIFLQFHYTFPKFVMRSVGDSKTLLTLYTVVNPVMIVFLTPLTGLLTRKMSSYKVIIFGSLVSALSVFAAAFPADLFSGFNKTIAGKLFYEELLSLPASEQQPIYIPLLLFIVIFSIGEALWSPRYSHYIVSVAPEGREGSYLSLAMLPYLIVKLGMGGVLGVLISKYLPEGGDLSSGYMVWIWAGVIALTTPVLLMVLRKFDLSKSFAR